MFWKNDSGYFALGLIAGISAAFLFVLYFTVFGVMCADGELTQVQSEEVRKTPLCFWNGFVETRDTAAQWIMTLFSIIASVLLLLTLWATQRMARETTRIGESQSRAYLHADKLEFFWGDAARSRPRVKVWVKNCGQTPVVWYRMRISVFAYKHEEPQPGDQKSSWDEIEFIDEVRGRWYGVGPDQSMNCEFHLVTDFEREQVQKAYCGVFDRGDYGLGVFGEVEYATIYDELFRSQFVFGRKGLPDYEIKEKKTVFNVQGEAGRKIEQGIVFSRYAFDAYVYKYIGRASVAEGAGTLT